MAQLRDAQGRFISSGATAGSGGGFLSMSVVVESLFPNVAKAAALAEFRSLGHAAATIRRDAAQSIDRSANPSEPGEPPHTRRGQLKRAFRFDVSEESAVVGPMLSMVGESAAAHEFGEEYKGQSFPERPFMAPALDRALPRFLRDWQGSIGE